MDALLDDIQAVLEKHSVNNDWEIMNVDASDGGVVFTVSTSYEETEDEQHFTFDCGGCANHFRCGVGHDQT